MTLNKTINHKNMRAFSFIELLEKKNKDSSGFKIINYSDKWYTWKDIEELSAVMAQDLQSLGVKQKSHVGICVKTSINWIIAFFAVQRLGAVSVLLNDTFSLPELLRACREADVEYLCAGNQIDVSAAINAPAEQNDSAEQNDLHCTCIKCTYNIDEQNDFCLRRNEYELLKNNSAFPEAALNADEKSIIIFTSGTTGKEKAIMLSLSNLSIPSEQERTFFENQNFICVLPLFHILGFMNILLALYTENTTVVLSPTLIPDDIVLLIQKHKCNALFSVPTMLLGIAESPKLTQEGALLLTKCILGGSSILAEQAKFIHKKLINCKLTGGYGMSETAVVSMTSPDDSDEIICSSIGKPFKNITLKIIDVETKKECAPGVTGELLIKGENLKAQYYRNTECQMLYDNDGFIHSGDLAYVSKDGYYFITGRIKNLIIRGGENIIPSELAQAVSKYPGVSQVEIVSLPDRFYGEVAGAAVVMQNGCTLDKEALIQFLHTMLTVNKIPAYFVQYERFPLLANGKTDLRSLRNDMLVKTKAH